MSTLVILGSARSDGNTRSFLDLVLANGPATVIDLCDHELGHYEYDMPSDRDGFAMMTTQMKSHSNLLLATPVYWYAMSGRMKVFFDRLTDLLDEGVSFKGKNVYLLSTGTKPSLPEGFEVPFRDTAKYLEMTYRGAIYACMREAGVVPDEAKRAAEDFSTQLFR